MSWSKPIEYWSVWVGDDPGDEKRLGPYTSLIEALADSPSYELSNRNGPRFYNKMMSFCGQISSVFILWDCEEPPTYFGEIMNRLKKES